MKEIETKTEIGVQLMSANQTILEKPDRMEHTVSRHDSKENKIEFIRNNSIQIIEIIFWAFLVSLFCLCLAALPEALNILINHK